MDQYAEEKSSTGKLVLMGCLIAIVALFTVGVLAVVGSIFLFGSSEGTVSYHYSISSDSDESPLEEFVPIEPADGPPPDFFEDLNSSTEDDE